MYDETGAFWQIFGDDTVSLERRRIVFRERQRNPHHVVRFGEGGIRVAIAIMLTPDDVRFQLVVQNAAHRLRRPNAGGSPLPAVRNPPQWRQARPRPHNGQMPKPRRPARQHSGPCRSSRHDTAARCAQYSEMDLAPSRCRGPYRPRTRPSRHWPRSHRCCGRARGHVDCAELPRSACAD